MTPEQLMRCICDEDIEGTEDARGDAVRLIQDPAQRQWFVEQYWLLKTWTQRCCFVFVFQDRIEPSLRPVMRHILEAPDTEDDTAPSAWAIGLCHLEGSFNNFMKYFSSRAEARAAMRAYQHEPSR